MKTVCRILALILLVAGLAGCGGRDLDRSEIENLIARVHPLSGRTYAHLLVAEIPEYRVAVRGFTLAERYSPDFVSLQDRLRIEERDGVLRTSAVYESQTLDARIRLELSEFSSAREAQEMWLSFLLNALSSMHAEPSEAHGIVIGDVAWGGEDRLHFIRGNIYVRIHGNASVAQEIDAQIIAALAEAERDLGLNETAALDRSAVRNLFDIDPATGREFAHSFVAEIPEYRAAVRNFTLPRRFSPDFVQTEIESIRGWTMRGERVPVLDALYESESTNTRFGVAVTIFDSAEDAQDEWLTPLLLSSSTNVPPAEANGIFVGDVARGYEGWLTFIRGNIHVSIGSYTTCIVAVAQELDAQIIAALARAGRSGA